MESKATFSLKKKRNGEPPLASDIAMFIEKVFCRTNANTYPCGFRTTFSSGEKSSNTKNYKNAVGGRH
ncbi:MAG: hypothetical protein ACLUSP_02085 [Christensenellales bacterium]